MIELAQHIETLLLENDCVIVPGFGGFVAHYAPATHIKEENLFLPPTRTIGFNPQLKLNDGVLVQSYMSAYDTSFSDATRIVEKEIKQFIELLHKEGKAQLENIGEIHYNIYGNYEFVPYDYKITTPSLYGLDSFEISELSTLKQKEKVLIPASLTKEKKTYENYLYDEIQNAILDRNLNYMQNISGGIFVISNVDKNSKHIIEYRANLLINAHLGSIAMQIKDFEEEYLESIKEVPDDTVMINFEEEKQRNLLDASKLKYYNEYGGFSLDGAEYHIRINKEEKLPTVWSNVMANRNFGTVVTEGLGGYTWYKNSRLRKNNCME